MQGLGVVVNQKNTPFEGLSSWPLSARAKRARQANAAQAHFIGARLCERALRSGSILANRTAERRILAALVAAHCWLTEMIACATLKVPLRGPPSAVRGPDGSH